MAGWQQQVIVGNLGADPKLTETKEGVPLCTFGVAVNQVWGSGDERREDTTWFEVAVYGKQAGPCAQYLEKGSLVLVVGKVKAHAYSGRDGELRASLDLTARDVRFLSAGRSSESDDTNEEIPLGFTFSDSD